MDISLKQFEQSLSGSGLLSPDEVREFREGLQPEPTIGEELAAALIREKKLTKFQADRIAQGDSDSLTFHEYVLVDKIGEGGMGEVYKARHRRMKRFVAIKAISPKSIDSPEAVQRFLREVEAAAQLDHPNIVPAYDAFEVDGRHFLVMKYVKGLDLSALVKSQGSLSVEQATDYVIQAARGLQYAHQQGIIHRDIKPGNLLVDKEGVTKIPRYGVGPH